MSPNNKKDEKLFDQYLLSVAMLSASIMNQFSFFFFENKAHSWLMCPVFEFIHLMSVKINI